ncbi:MAG: AAA family ATPase [Anaerolineae bacterium]|nr:AAA family ATPase [Anaerolineae bacterium]
MPTPINDLFHTDDPDLLPKGSEDWNQAVFERAFCGPDGSFERVCERLRQHFSVLVYLPGNCMNAAAEVIKQKVGGDWTELGKPAGPGPTGSGGGAALGERASDIWLSSRSMFDIIHSWFTRGRHTRPMAIFHNLDLLGDGRGGMLSSDEAKTALLYVTESTRSGVVLGMSDRDAGELPEPISRPFAEKIWLDEIPANQFVRIIPRKLGMLLADRKQLPDGAAWLLASRLRWTDPLRAVRIMDSVAERMSSGDLGEILQEIMAATHTVEFLDPDKIPDIDLDASGNPTGFEPEVITFLRQNAIDPFRRWADFSGTRDECLREIRRLPPGIILWGPPGTGKSRLARWIAKSISLPIRQVSAADLKRPDWGLTERLVRELFQSARRAAPCVVVLDDADDLLPDRGSVAGSVSSAERGIVNAFLQELQGFGRQPEGVLVILTTNRYESLDRAAKSRLPLHMRIPYPLDPDQVGQIVSSIAQSYGLVLTDEIQDSLVTLFMRPIVDTEKAVSTPDERRRIDDNLYAPRDIEAAMRLLITASGAQPGAEDVKRMQRYWKRVSEGSTRQPPK